MSNQVQQIKDIKSNALSLDTIDSCLHSCVFSGEPIHSSLLSEGLKLPNMCSDRVLDMGAENKLVVEKPFTNPSFKLRKFEDIARILSGAKLTNLGLLTGERTYYLTGVLAELEQVNTGFLLVEWI